MYGETEAMRRDTPKLTKRAMDSTFSRFRVGAASVQTIQMRGDMTPDASCQRKRMAKDAALDRLVEGDTAVTTDAIKSIKTPHQAELQMSTGRRPYLSGRKWPVRIPA